MPARPLSVALSLEVPENLAERIAHVIRGLLSELASALIEQAGSGVSKSLREAASRAQDLVLRCEFDPLVFDRECRAALRAAGFELPDRNGGHDASPIGGLSAPMVARGGGLGNEPAPEAR